AADPERQMRGIQRFHMDSRGWCDVGYHFLVGQDGRVYEGRPLNLLGAHVGRNNTGNIGISFIGCFHSSGCGSLSGSRIPNDASLNAASALIGRLSRIYGISIDPSRVKGHTQHSGQSTSCPGANLLSRLDSIRSRASGATTPPPGPTPTPMPEPTPEPTPEPEPSPAPTGASCTHSFGGTYADTACSTSWQCCDGAWRGRGSCGSCACVEGSGEVGCSGSGEPPPAPAGPSCRARGTTGTCMNVSACAGTTTAGLCPGAANIQCCTP
ncbi:MAG: N-acetylmuramoyl-L-alanine amidase, partial [Sandaracinaceae bacterium]